MIRAKLKDGVVYLQADATDVPIIHRLQGASRTSKMPPLTWWMPMTMETVAALKCEHIPVSPELAQRAKEMLRSKAYIDRMKAADHVEPMRAIPIREGCVLYNHQVKAYNIALSLFGYEEEGGTEHD